MTFKCHIHTQGEAGQAGTPTPAMQSTRLQAPLPHLLRDALIIMIIITAMHSLVPRLLPGSVCCILDSMLQKLLLGRSLGIRLYHLTIVTTIINHHHHYHPSIIITSSSSPSSHHLIIPSLSSPSSSPHHLIISSSHHHHIILDH